MKGRCNRDSCEGDSETYEECYLRHRANFLRNKDVLTKRAIDALLEEFHSEATDCGGQYINDDGKLPDTEHEETISLLLSKKTIQHLIWHYEETHGK